MSKKVRHLRQNYLASCFGYARKLILIIITSHLQLTIISIAKDSEVFKDKDFVSDLLKDVDVDQNDEDIKVRITSHLP